MIIKVTEAAVKKIVELKGDKQKMLRIAIVNGGCSGLSYKLGWDDLKPDDHMLNIDTINIIMDPKSVSYTVGMELDYVDGLDGSGFTFNNPSATRCCHCNKSFSCA